MDNLYMVMGVNQKASKDEIKKRYRELAKRFHPDSNSGEADSISFGEINIAYSILSNDEARKEYDKTGQMPSSEKLESGAIREHLILLFLTKLNKLGSHIFNIDIIVEMQKELIKAKQAQEMEISKAEAHVVFLEEVQKRIVVKNESEVDDFNFLRGALNNEIRGIQQQLFKMKTHKSIHDKSIELLKSFKFEFDNKQS